MKTLTISTLLAISVILPARAENWVELGRNHIGTSEEYAISIDTDSIVRKGDIFIYNTMQQDLTPLVSILRFKLSCFNRTMTFIGSAHYRYGKLLNSRMFPPNEQRTAIVQPEKMNYLHYQYLCES